MCTGRTRAAHWWRTCGCQRGEIEPIRHGSRIKTSPHVRCTAHYICASGQHSREEVTLVVVNLSPTTFTRGPWLGLRFFRMMQIPLWGSPATLTLAGDLCTSINR